MSKRMRKKLLRAKQPSRRFVECPECGGTGRKKWKSMSGDDACEYGCMQCSGTGKIGRELFAKLVEDILIS